MSREEERFKTSVETILLDFLDEADITCKEANIPLDKFLSDKKVTEVFAQWILKQTRSSLSA